MTMTELFAWEQRVRWRHLDPAGIMHFAAIFEFFEAAEFEFFRTLGYQPADLHPGLPRVHCSADYRGTARLDELVTTEVTVEHVGTSSFRLGFRSHIGDRHIADGVTAIVQANETTGQATPLTEGLKLAGPLRAYADSSPSDLRS